MTDDERKARNRLYQHTRRHKDNNAYARAQRRVQQRAAAWFKENKLGTWERWMREELEAERQRGKEGTVAKYAPIKGFTNSRDTCDHGGDDGSRFAIGVAVACTLCGNIMGTVHVDDSERDELDVMIGGIRPEEG